MSMIKRLFQQVRPGQKAEAHTLPDHPNFWMYQ